MSAISSLSKLLFIVSVFVDCSSSGQYKSYWIPSAKWNKVIDRPKDPSSYGRYMGSIKNYRILYQLY